MNDVLQCIMKRRSIRKYRNVRISDKELDTILEAGLYAPSAGNRQSAIIIVSQNAEINTALGRINRMAFTGMVSTKERYISKDQPSIADNPAIESGFYGAPTVLTIFAPDNFLYAPLDAAIMGQTRMLAAHSVGVGSCMVARAEATFDSEYGQGLLKKWNIPDDYEAKIHILLGYVDGEYPSVKPRKENRIKRIW
jgi:nitroreductase